MIASVGSGLGSLDAACVHNRWQGWEVVQLVGNSAYGGGVPIIFGLMDACAKVGLHPTLLASHPDVVAAAKAKGLDVWEFHGIERQPQPLRDLMAACRLARALRRRRVRIVHTHTTKGGMVGRLAAWLAGCDVVIHHTHGFYHTGLHPGWRRTAMQALERVFARFGDFQVFLTVAEAEQAVAQRIVPAHKVRVVPNGIFDPRASISPARSALLREWSLPADCVLVGTVSRLDIEQKGLDAGLRAMREVVNEIPNAYYVIVGKGEDEAHLREMAHALGIQRNVRFVGHRDDAASLPSVFDVCLYPSVKEGQSISVLEAMAWGRPLVVTRIMGTSELVDHGRSALVCEPGDFLRMADAVIRLIREPTLAAQLGRGARQRYDATYTWESFMARAESVYIDMLSLVVEPQESRC